MKINNELKELAEQFWYEAKRQGLIVDCIYFETSVSISNDYRLIGQAVNAKIIEREEGTK